MKTSILAVAVALAFFAPRLAAAQAVPPANTAKVFTAVDAVKAEDYKVVITGIVQGDGAPSTWSAGFYSSSDGALISQFVNSCQTQALLAMTKPGQYLLEIQSGTISLRPFCKLSRVNP